MARFSRLRALGPIGNALANALAVLTANWPVAMSAIAAILAGALDWLRGVALSPPFVTAVWVFLAVLWTIVGITVLIDRRRPRFVISHMDYRYGLTYEGMQPRYLGVNDPLPDAGSLHFVFMIRNFSPGPIRYEVENLEVRLGTRATPKIQRGTLSGFMARGAGRTSQIKGFTKEQLKEFYKHSDVNDPAKGTIEISYLYGPPDGPPVRRLRMSLEFWVMFNQEGAGPLGWQDGIKSEDDEPLEPHR